MKMIAWDEPDLTGNTVRKKLTVKEAIEHQKDAAERHNHVYQSDKEALRDFITIHWAWEEEEL
jgi:hypothetical protein